MGRIGKCYTVSMNQVRATVATHEMVIDSEQVERSVRDVLPEPLGDHYVVVQGRRFPPKQVICVVTGLDRADFNTHQARRILSRLGFTVGRRSTDPVRKAPQRPGPHGGHEADALRPFVGKWVAQRGVDVLVAADTPQEVLIWLERHDERADAMFRVPASAAETAGSAPE
jgi:hypothetical protein